MYREDLIEAIVNTAFGTLTEGKWRRGISHATSGGIAGSLIATPVTGAMRYADMKKGGSGAIANVADWAAAGAGAGVQTNLSGKDLKRMEKTKGRQARAAAGRKFGRKHGWQAAMILPKDEIQRKKLAKRGVAGHVGHTILRGVGGPLNQARYLNKVSYAKSGFRR